MSAVVKAVKKVVKGVTKVVKSVVKTVGKVVEKLGPVGTIAIGILAPMAVGAMMQSGIGWVQSLGNALNTVGQVVSAPFKAIKAVGSNLLGQAAGGLSEMVGGTSNFLGKGLSTISEQLIGASGSETLSGAFNNAMSGVKEAFGIGQDVVSQSNAFSAFGAGAENAQMLAEQTAAFGDYGTASTLESMGIQVGDYSGLSDSIVGDWTTQAAQGVIPGSEQYNMLREQEFTLNEDGTVDKDLSFGTQADYNKGLLADTTVQALGGTGGYTTGLLDTNTYSDTFKKALSAFGSMGTDPGQLGQGLPEISTAGYEQETAAGQGGAGEQGLGYELSILNPNQQIASAQGSIGLQSGYQLQNLLAAALGKDMRGRAYV